MIIERRPAWIGWIETFMEYINIIARRTTIFWGLETCPLRGVVRKARANVEMMTPVVPPMMNGFRRPQRLRVRSLKTPTIGWTATPHSGAASQIRAVNDFENPRDKRYGFKAGQD